MRSKRVGRGLLMMSSAFAGWFSSVSVVKRMRRVLFLRWIGLLRVLVFLSTVLTLFSMRHTTDP
jgi:hypothetical protein